MTSSNQGDDSSVGQLEVKWASINILDKPGLDKATKLKNTENMGGLFMHTAYPNLHLCLKSGGIQWCTNNYSNDFHTKVGLFHGLWTLIKVF